MGRHCHDGARAIACQDIVTNIYRYILAGDGIDGITASEHAAHLLLNHAFTLGLVLHLVEIGIDSSTLVGRHHLVHVDALGSQYHEGHTEDGVGPGGENQQALVTVGDGEGHLGTLAVADPVALRFLDRLGPLDGVQVTQQTSGIGRHAQAPLAHDFLLHGIAATNRQTLAHLVVGQHSAQLGTPVHHRVAQIGDAVVHEHVIVLNLGHGVPLLGGKRVGAVGVRIATLGTVLLKMSHQFIDGARLVEFGVVITLEHLQEGPLCPLVIFGVTGAHLAVPVIAETNLVQLLTVACDVLVGGDFRVLARLDGILLGGQAVGIIAHGMQHVETALALVARIDVAGDVAQRMSHVQTRSRRIREHIQHIELGTVIVDVALVGVMLTPVLLPLFLYLFKIVIHFY